MLGKRRGGVPEPVPEDPCRVGEGSERESLRGVKTGGTHTRRVGPDRPVGTLPYSGRRPTGERKLSCEFVERTPWVYDSYGLRGSTFLSKKEGWFIPHLV